jgi:hypothetical protein
MKLTLILATALTITAFMTVACGQATTKPDCASGTQSGRVDQSQTCAIYGDSSWDDTRLADADAECVSLMSATDSYRQPRLNSFCRCISEENARQNSYQEFKQDPLETITAAYDQYASQCSASTHYEVPSKGDQIVMTKVEYQDFMKDCSDAGASPSRQACRCLALEAVKVGYFKFADALDESIHRCGFVSKKN